MTKIQTDISRQEIHIEGITFTAADARLASDGGPSRLQHLFSEDKSGFKSSLADFLAEWFNETDTSESSYFRFYRHTERIMGGETTHDGKRTPYR